jgi:hypothetical protein
MRSGFIEDLVVVFTLAFSKFVLMPRFQGELGLAGDLSGGASFRAFAKFLQRSAIPIPKIKTNTEPTPIITSFWVCFSGVGSGVGVGVGSGTIS